MLIVGSKVEYRLVNTFLTTIISATAKADLLQTSEIEVIRKIAKQMLVSMEKEVTQTVLQQTPKIKIQEEMNATDKIAQELHNQSQVMAPTIDINNNQQRIIEVSRKLNIFWQMCLSGIGCILLIVLIALVTVYDDQ